MPAALGKILIHTPDGGRVPLAQLAKIEVVDGASIIARRENRRQIAVRTNIRGRDQGGFVKEAQERFASTIQLPSDYRVEWGGQFENLERARRRLTFILPVTIAIIFTLLFFAFGSPVYAGLVLLNVPFSLVGGIVALWIRGINLSVSAAVGFVSLFGVAVMSGVLVVAEINRQRVQTGTTAKEAVIRGALGPGQASVNDGLSGAAGNGAGRTSHWHWLGRAKAAGYCSSGGVMLHFAAYSCGAAVSLLSDGKRTKRRYRVKTNVKMLLIFHDETDMFGEMPLYEAIVQRLHERDISGATVQRGIMGFGGHGKVHRKGLFGISDDRPITIYVVDTADKLEPVIPEIRGMIEEGVVLLVDAQMVV